MLRKDGLRDIELMNCIRQEMKRMNFVPFLVDWKMKQIFYEL